MYPNQYVPQPQYYAPRPPGTLSKLFDLSFQGFVTRGSLRGLFTSVLALLGAYWFFALIFGIIAAAKYQGIWCIVIFSSLILVTLMIIWTRILMELTMTVTEMRAEMQQAAQMAEAREAKLAAAVKAAEANKRPAAASAAKAAAKASPRSGLERGCEEDFHEDQEIGSRCRPRVTAGAQRRGRLGRDAF